MFPQYTPTHTTDKRRYLKERCDTLTPHADRCRSLDHQRAQYSCDLSDKSGEEVGGLKTDYVDNPYDHYEVMPSGTPTPIPESGKRF